MDWTEGVVLFFAGLTFMFVVALFVFCGYRCWQALKQEITKEPESTRLDNYEVMDVEVSDEEDDTID